MSRFLETELGRRLTQGAKLTDEDVVEHALTDILARIRAERLSHGDIEAAAGILQRARRFDAVIRIAEAVIGRTSYGTAPVDLLRRYCQALIERGAFTAASRLLNDMAERLADIDLQDEAALHDLAEVQGLQGRTAKQKYVEYRNDADLIEAMERYGGAFDRCSTKHDGASRSKAIWHGGNLLALDLLAERYEVPIDDGVRPDRSQLIGKLDALIGREFDVLDVFERGTLLEVMLADDTPQSLEQAVSIAVSIGAAQHATVFELASIRRQLVEIWELELNHPVLASLNGAILQCGVGATVTVTAGHELEKMVGGARPVFHDILERAIEVAYPVCMVTEVSGVAIGTGFLLPGSELSKDFSDDLVLVTNNHVVTTKPRNGRSTARPEHARARFELLEDAGGDAISVTGLMEIWTDSDLDVTVLQLDAPAQLANVPPIRVAHSLPSTDVPDPYVFVVGHPLGQRLSYAIRGNELIEVGQALLHYKAPTEPGSSGSPVFNEAFELVGVHRGGGFAVPSISDSDIRRPANEAVTISAIRERLALS